MEFHNESFIVKACSHSLIKIFQPNSGIDNLILKISYLLGKMNHCRSWTIGSTDFSNVILLLFTTWMISNHTLTNSKTILIECQFLIGHFWVKKYPYPFYVLHPIMGIHVTKPLKDLEFLKYQNLPGPFSTAEEVDLYMNYNESDSVRIIEFTSFRNSSVVLPENNGQWW